MAEQDNPDVSKGTSFVTQSFIRNQALANKEGAPLTNALTKNVGVFNGLAKQLTILNQNLNKMITKPSEKKKDFVRREDPMKKLYLAVDDLEELFRESVRLQKEKDKKSKGLLEWVGALMGLGGLLGFLLTGKTEMLFSTIKALTKYSPIKYLLGFVDDVIKKVAPKLFEGIGKMFGGIGSLIMKVPGVKQIVGIAEKVVKPVMGMFKGISHVFEPLGKLFGGALAKEGAKAGAKGVGMAVLKKIPVVGGLIGLFLGIQRFKKGDIVGGILEIASGISSVIPGVGTAIGVAIDAFLLFRDFTTPVGEKPPQPNWGKMGMTALKALPGIGTIIHFKEAFKMWKTDKMGAMKEIGLALGSLVPGANLILDPVLSFAQQFMPGGDNKPPTVDATTGADKPVEAAKDIPKEKKKGFWAKVAGKVLQGSREFKASSEEFLASSQSGYGGSMTAGTTGGASNIQPSSMTSVGKITDLNSLKEAIKQREGLRLEAYPDAFGTSVGYGHFLGAGKGGLGTKITKEQADEYFEKDFAKAVSSASTIPNFGKAPFPVQAAMIDMTYNMGPGWISKFKNTVKAIGKGDYATAAAGIRNSLYYKQVTPRAEANVQAFLQAAGQGTGIETAVPSATPVAPSEGVSSEPTVAQAGSNLPTSYIAPTVAPSGQSKIDLSESTIQALAQAMGTSFKGSWPTQRPNVISIDANMRG